MLESTAIEDQIKDLAGARLIFYTNSDVDHFLNSRLIPENFEVFWDETKIHHPTKENADQRYQAIHYTVGLNEARIALPEYSKFKGMRCEIQIQTILSHAWAETSHDIIYKPLESKGFGRKAMDAIDRRLTKIMDDYLLPAGYEFQKIQHDFQRLMQGKQLFDRGVIEVLDSCNNNNQRHDIVASIKEYVLPNYDDIEAIYPELIQALLRAVDKARVTQNEPIKTPFGDLDGQTPGAVTTLVISILENLRYVDVEATFKAFGRVYQFEEDEDLRKTILKTVEELARYDLDVCRQVGLGVQFALTAAIDNLSPDDRRLLWPLLHTAWQEFLNSEVRGISASADAIALNTGALPASDDLKSIRKKAIDGLFEFYDLTSSENEKRSILSSLWRATHLPSQAGYSNELRSLVLNDENRIVEELTARASHDPYEILEHIERHLLREYGRARQIVEAENDRFGCKDLAAKLGASILAFRDAINANPQFVRYKILVGYESVVPLQWEQPDVDYSEVEKYRRARIAEYIDAISEATEDEWYGIIKRCAATKSNDGATFRLFGEFLVRLAKDNPDTAERFLLRADENILTFLPAVLQGLYQSESNLTYERTIRRYLSDGRHLTALARQWRLSKSQDQKFIKDVLSKAVACGDDIAVMECVVGAIANHKEPNQPAIDDFFVPAIKYLTEKNDARWINGAWFLPEAETFFTKLPLCTTELVLDNMLSVSRIDTHAERILTCIAGAHPGAVWKYFGRRLTDNEERDPKIRYEPIPYSFHWLQKPLGNDAEAAVDVARQWYRPDDPLFEYREAQLLSAVFPDFPGGFARKLLAMAASGSDDDIGFILRILRRYRGEPATHGVLKQLVDRLPDDDPRLQQAEICLQNTGVVSGEFGFAEAFRAKKAEISSWANDDRPKVRAFAEHFTRYLDQRIASEQRTAEQRKEMRRREFDA